MRTLKVKIFLLILFFLFQGEVLAQCGNCRPNKYSLIYSYLIPNKIKQFTNPALRTNQVINTVRNPSLLLSPCNPITNTTANLINRGIHHIPDENNSNKYTASYIPPASENAYISGFNESNPDSNNSYFDENTNSYIWILPEGK